MSRTFQAFCVSALAFAALATPAAAETGRYNSDTRVQVFYGDLDTTSEAGARVLLRRVDAAARQVCGVDTHARGLISHQQRTCHANAVAKAIARVNSPVATQMLTERTDARQVFASR